MTRLEKLEESRGFRGVVGGVNMAVGGCPGGGSEWLAEAETGVAGGVLMVCLSGGGLRAVAIWHKTRSEMVR